MPVEVEDRVADELSGAVVRRLPAAVGLHHLHVHAVGEVELGRLVRPAPERDDGFVLEHEHRVGQRFPAFTSSAIARWSPSASRYEVSPGMETRYAPAIDPSLDVAIA